MASIEIEYCGRCRFGEQAATTRRVLLSWLRERPDVDAEQVTLSPATEDILCVAVDGERVWCASEPGRRVDAVEAVNAVRRRLAG
ncbi:Rdx family protein [Halosegnis sp.]|uniref:Rdx family protein n=1 Tax=Halosegnis sp. TaxID=2864959 RepID=UPI0035D4B181